MKKILSALTIAVLLIPMVALGQTIESCALTRDLSDITGRTNCRRGAEIRYDGPDAICCLFNTVYKVVDWVFTFLLAIAVLFGLLGSYKILTSAGSPEAVEEGKNKITYAVAGLIVALLAKALPSFVKLLVM